MKLKSAMILALAVLAGCKEDIANAQLPAAQSLTQEAAGFYCQMEILEHPGPKAQVHLAGMQAPLWFSQVRDGLAYVKSAEQSGEILVLYVNDMGAAVSWSEPGVDNWIKADGAFYVVGSNAAGGMGAPELVPFADRQAADKFIAVHSGEILQFSDIPIEMVLSPVTFTTSQLEARQ